ncbi:hypothetical protein EVA_20273, partial [gut metagenome]
MKYIGHGENEKYLKNLLLKLRSSDMIALDHVLFYGS